MPFCVVRHKVADFDKWKKVFDEHASSREKAGCRGGFVFRNDDDKNEVILLLDFAESGPLKEFLGSDDLKGAMEKAGVAGPPDIVVAEEFYKADH